MVPHEDNQPKSNARTGSSTKRSKANKTPQRGLGVAQLEKIRMAEQQKNNTMPAAAAAAASSPSSSSIPLMAPVFKSPFHSSSMIDCFKPDPFRPDNKSLSGFSPVGAPLMNDASRNQQISAPLVNRAGLMPSSSGDNLQIEPPSLQNYSINSNMQSSLRIAGMNTHWPFPHPHFTAPFKFETKPAFAFGNSSSKEGGSNSGLYQVDWKDPEFQFNKRKRESGDSGDNASPSLGHPVIQSVPRFKPSINEYHGFPLFSCQGVTDNDVLQSLDSRRRPFYYFLPERPTVNETDTRKQSDGCEEDDVETKLKL